MYTSSADSGDGASTRRRSGVAPTQVAIDYDVLEALQEREQRLAEAQRVARIGSWEWDVAADVVTWSDQLYRVFGLEVEELEPTYEGYLARVHPDDRERQAALVARAVQEQEPFDSLHRVVTSSGAVRWVHSLGEVAVDREGTVVRLYGTAQDVSRYIAAHDPDELDGDDGDADTHPTRDAHRDAGEAAFEPLTGLANRALFDDRARRALQRAARAGWWTAVVAVDLDGFASINQQFGRTAGDGVLMEAAHRLQGVVRPYDSVAGSPGTVTRHDGDRFLVLCENVPDAAAARSVSARVATCFARPFAVGKLSASIGVARVGPGVTDIDVAVASAEDALRRAKEHGAGATEISSDHAHDHGRGPTEGADELRAGLEHNQFLLHYQPKVLLANDCVVGVEALVRWQHPDRGLVPPNEFIALAEQTDLIADLGAWVLEEACRQVRLWHDRLPDRPPLVVAVNVSARQFRSDLVATVADVLERTGIDASRLCLEVTESTVMGDVDSAIDVLNRIKSLGVAISIDDFGTGYSSLAYLRRFPLDELKIDRSFVDGLGGEAEDTAIVAAIVAMAHALDLDVVAEGVETEEQLARLRVLGCEQVQGFHLARPMPAAALERFVTDADRTLSGRTDGDRAADFSGGYRAEDVVVADDSPQVLQLAAVSLGAAGFQVHQADNGRAALELARRLRPSCVVLDVRMPDMDGIQVCQALRADPATAGCTIVMLTANADPADKVEGFSAGADDYIVKPFAPRDLVGRVRAAIRRHDEPIRPSDGDGGP